MGIALRVRVRVMFAMRGDATNRVALQSKRAENSKHVFKRLEQP
jgi:hypothetical protein